ncbi:hypothetical protein BJX61DRAFT_281253 [Aspergillus egyptiacus]|nr:hypothetical protein BJX61DRAFT_281253 [Aspergillus egyptiacus]
MSAFDDLPPIYIPKRRPDDLKRLREELDAAEQERSRAQKRMKTRGGFNEEFWADAYDAEAAKLRKTRIFSDISVSEFDGEVAEWKRTDEARKLFELLRAQEHRVASFSRQRDNLSLCKPKRSLRAAFMKFFTTSPTGLDQGKNAGAGKRDPSKQSQFREQMLRDYESLDKHSAWCPILGAWVSKENVVAAHLFPYKAGQDAMDAIFGRVRPAELFSSRNGLVIYRDVERYFDKGIMVVVPDLPERPTRSALQFWRNSEIRDYKLRIIRKDWERMDSFFTVGVRWRDLDGKRLEFRGPFRPAARYVYFHYCMQILRRAWQAGSPPGAVPILQDELGKPFWGTPGKYIAKNMLRAVMEEVGHDAEGLLVGARPTILPGDRNMLLDVAAAKVVEDKEEKEEDEEDEEDEDTGEDGLMPESEVE